MKEKTCCFFGHRKIEDTLELFIKLYDVIERLITEEKIDTFLFGSKSQFNSLCLEIVTALKKTYPHIKRIYVRAEFPYISKDYTDYLLESYDDTYYPEKMIGAGKAVYIERNCEMIDKSRICVVYYSPDYVPALRKAPHHSIHDTYQRKSGTKIAYEYAQKKGKTIINMACCQ